MGTAGWIVEDLGNRRVPTHDGIVEVGKPSRSDVERPAQEGVVLAQPDSGNQGAEVREGKAGSRGVLDPLLVRRNSDFNGPCEALGEG